MKKIFPPYLFILVYSFIREFRVYSNPQNYLVKLWKKNPQFYSLHYDYVQWLSSLQSKAEPSEETSTMQPQQLTLKVLLTNVTLSKGQASVDQATSSNATLTTVTPLSTPPPPATTPQPPMSPSSALVYQYFILLSYFVGQFSC